MLKQLSLAVALVMSLPAQARPAPRATSWIVGDWVGRGESCQSDTGLTFARNGTYTANGNETGRWTLVGATLSFTALETFEMGEEGSTRIRNPRPFRHQILSHSANAYSSRAPGGSVSNMVRCH